MRSIIYQTSKRIGEGAGRVSILSLALITVLLTVTTGCKKLVEADPPYTNLNGLNVYESDVTATAVLTGAYVNMSQASFTGGGFFGGGSGITSMALFPGMSADELTLFYQGTPSYLNYYKNTLTSLNTGSTDFWTNFYKFVAVSNGAIEGIDKSTSLSPAVRKQLLGEARFIRAFCYFYLVNLYGDVPLVLSNNPQVNRLLARAPKDQVYAQIIADLKDAVDLLNSNYVKNDIVSTTTERIRPNKAAAQALLARAYLYKGDNENAETMATNVISNTAMYDTVSLNNVFLKNSKEAIWQLQPVLTNPSNTQDARLFVLQASGPNFSYPVFLSDNIANSFEVNDQRKSQWVGSVTPTPPGTTTFNFPYKYKNIGLTTTVTEYLMVLRLSEQYLIRAEARAQLNNTTGAQSDLNVVRKRAGLPNTTAADKPSLLTAIMKERKVELFTEWGHRWLDLKRTGTVDAVMTAVAPQKATTWNTNWQLYPIPTTDMGTDPNLIQNPGYN
jgi:hypothetical protein